MSFAKTYPVNCIERGYTPAICSLLSSIDTKFVSIGDLTAKIQTRINQLQVEKADLQTKLQRAEQDYLACLNQLPRGGESSGASAENALLAEKDETIRQLNEQIAAKDLAIENMKSMLAASDGPLATVVNNLNTVEQNLQGLTAPAPATQFQYGQQPPPNVPPSEPGVVRPISAAVNVPRRAVRRSARVAARAPFVSINRRRNNPLVASIPVDQAPVAPISVSEAPIPVSLPVFRPEFVPISRRRQSIFQPSPENIRRSARIAQREAGRRAEQGEVQWARRSQRAAASRNLQRENRRVIQQALKAAADAAAAKAAADAAAAEAAAAAASELVAVQEEANASLPAEQMVVDSAPPA